MIGGLGFDDSWGTELFLSLCPVWIWALRSFQSNKHPGHLHRSKAVGLCILALTSTYCQKLGKAIALPPLPYTLFLVLYLVKHRPPLPLQLSLLLHGATTASGLGPPHYRNFTITHRHTTLARAPLDE